jgi:ABC-type transporter Mla subunit MlaD
MRSPQEIEQDAKAIQLQINTKNRLHKISKFDGANELSVLFSETKEYYEQAIRSLDENSPALNKEYAKLKACLSLVNGFISAINNSASDINKLEKALLTLNAELQKTHEEIRRREKAAF